VSWSRDFEDPIQPPKGKPLVTAWLGIVILGAIFATNANAQAELERLPFDRRWIEGAARLLRWCCPTRSETKTASCEGGRRLQIAERGGRAVGLFQSLFGAASASESCSKSRSEGSTVEVKRLVELGLKGNGRSLTDSRPISRLEVVDTGRRRRWSDEAKVRIVEESTSLARRRAHAHREPPAGTAS
jgi:hypothetical protein